MAASQADVKDRISSVQNIRKITRAMEMVAAARLRRAEQRIEALRPYAAAIRRMTRQAADAAGAEVSSMPVLQEHESLDKVALLLVTGDRGLAGAFNSRIIRAGLRAAGEHESQGRQVVFSASGRRGVSTLTFRGREIAGSYVGFTDRPAYANAREIGQDLVTAYVDGEVDQVEIIYNGYVSALTQEVRRETLLPLQQATILEAGDEEGGDADDATGSGGGADEHEGGGRALVEYEPDPEEILGRLVPEYVEISVYRALLESTASEHGARMTAMRNASENAGDIIQDLTLEMNRARQAEITQEIMEVVAGAEALG
jgi:F-type H+-transporting ATPase subunit gamma